MLRRKYQSGISKDKELIESYINDLYKQVKNDINSIEIPNEYDDSPIRQELIALSNNKLDILVYKKELKAIELALSNIDIPDTKPLTEKLNKLSEYINALSIPSVEGLVSEELLKDKLRALRLALEADIKKKIKDIPSGLQSIAIKKQLVKSVNGQTGVIVLDTDDIEEGATNLYFTNLRATTALTGANISIFNNDVGYITSAPIDSVNGQTGDVVTQIVDTRANIFALTPENGTTAYSTDTKQYYVYNDAWEEFSSIQSTRASNYDIGYEQESNLAGYGSDYITDKRISNCLIGENAREELGGIRVTYADSLERNIAQYYLDGEWKTALTGVNIQTDDTENPVDIEFTDFSPWVLSLITGNSDAKDYNGVPMVQNMKVDMGVFSSPLLIDGGSF